MRTHMKMQPITTLHKPVAYKVMAAQAREDLQSQAGPNRMPPVKSAKENHESQTKGHPTAKGHDGDGLAKTAKDARRALMEKAGKMQPHGAFDGGQRADRVDIEPHGGHQESEPHHNDPKYGEELANKREREQRREHNASSRRHLRREQREDDASHRHARELHARERDAQGRDSRVQEHQEQHHSKRKIWCGNNIRDPKLARNGGDLRIGKPSECFRRGVGGGIYQKIEPGKESDFLTTWTGPYEKRINQPLFYGDGPVPDGKIRATLGQCLSRGFAVGSIQKAEKILKRRQNDGRRH